MFAAPANGLLEVRIGALDIWSARHVVIVGPVANRNANAVSLSARAVMKSFALKVKHLRIDAPRGNLLDISLGKVSRPVVLKRSLCASRLVKGPLVAGFGKGAAEHGRVHPLLEHQPVANVDSSNGCRQCSSASAN